MEYRVWAPRYAQIRRALGFPLARERAAAAVLTRLLPPAARAPALPRLRSRLAGRPAIVAGLAPGAGAPPLWRLPAGRPTPSIVAADGATAGCLATAVVPTVIVTDLDGPVAAEVTANGRGSLVVVHAHGDNVPALEQWVPEFPGPLAGSWSGPPTRALLDVGGFTDGDRAAYLAEAAGASEVWLWGFDFERVEASDPTDRARKLAKLAWARTALEDLVARGRAPLLVWQRDGTLEPFPVVGPTPGPTRPGRPPRARSRRSARTAAPRTRRPPRD